MADISTKGFFTKSTFDELSSLIQVGKSYPRLTDSDQISAIIDRARTATPLRNTLGQGHIKHRTFVSVIRKPSKVRTYASIKAELTQLLHPSTQTQPTHKAYVCRVSNTVCKLVGSRICL